jgi:hypothetical protein
MVRPVKLAALVLAASLAVPLVLHAQGWSPPSRDMPAMPAVAELQGGWVASQGAWFAGVGEVSGLRGSASGARAGKALQVRFTNSATPVPVAVWSDRNGDGKADMIEIYRRGAVAFQLIDADYDGTANVVREYDGNGGLAREVRL